MSERLLSKRGMIGIFLGYAAVWLLLMLGANLGTAYLRLGRFAPAVHQGIAAIQVLLFMNLRGSSAPARLCASTSLLWLIFMFSLTFFDYLTRDSNGALTPFSERAATVGTR